MDSESDESGKVPFDLVSWNETESRRTTAAAGWKAVRMHKSQFLKRLEKTRPLFTEGGRREEWERLLKEAEDDDKREDGPPEEPLRITILKEDRAYGKQGVDHSKSVCLSSKGMKVTNEKQIEEAKDKIRRGALGYDDSLFKGLVCTGALGVKRTAGALNNATGAQAQKGFAAAAQLTLKGGSPKKAKICG